MKNFDPLESVLGRVDDLDQVNLGILVSRLARERRLLNTVFNSLREGILVIDSGGHAPAMPMSRLYPCLASSRRISAQRAFGRRSPISPAPFASMPPATSPKPQVFSREAETDLIPESRLVRIYLVPFDEDVHGQQVAPATPLSYPTSRSKRRVRKQQIEDERVCAPSSNCPPGWPMSWGIRSTPSIFTSS